MFKNLKNLRKIELGFVDLIVVASFYFFCVLLFLSLTGLFKKELIAFSVVVFLLLSAVFCRKIVFRKHYLFFFVLIPLFFTGILLFSGSFAGDALSYWLPWAREIVLQQKMPDFLPSTIAWAASREPLVPLFFAAIFSFFGFKASLATALVFFFSASAILLLFQWFKEKGIDKKYLFFGILLFLANPIFFQYGGSLHQEAFVLFFFTAFFYYLEKYQTTRNRFHFFLLLLSFILAIAAKFTGLILVLPLAWLIVKSKNKSRAFFSLFLALFPLLVWFARTYLIYGNPVLPFLNNLFKGPYSDLIAASARIEQQTYLAFSDGLWTRFVSTAPAVFLLFCPFLILSFYGFWKKRKIPYLILFLMFFSAIFWFTPFPNYYRYLLPFLGVLAVYALAGLEKMKSRPLLSAAFFVGLWGLFGTEIVFSQSRFFAFFEGKLAVFSQVSQFLHDYSLVSAAVLSVFFYFFISQKDHAKYLLLLAVGSYLVKSGAVQIGSWLNVWLPILFLILIILVSAFLTKFKEGILRRSVLTYIVVLLVFGGWGLFALYSAAYRGITFPNLKEAYGVLPRVASELGEREGANRDFYVYVSSSGYLTWYHGYRVVTYRTPAFHIITGLQYNDNLSPEAIRDLFQKSGIRYIVENNDNEQLQPFYNKIKSRPDLFIPIEDFLWRINSNKPAKL